MTGFDILQGALKGSTPQDGPVAGAPVYASVCVVLGGPIEAPNICLIRRVRWDGDPWSEHIAFPGGSRKDRETASQTVRREVLEEVGLVIDEGAELTQLPQLRIRLAGRDGMLLLDSFLHFVGESPPSFRLGEEVDDAFWVSASSLWDAGKLECLTIGDDGDTLVYPALRIPQGLVFGITLRVLMLLSDRLEMPLPFLEEIPLLRRDAKGPS